jgi:hypothetical protein
MINNLNTRPHPLLMKNNEWDHTIILNNRQVTTDIVDQHLYISYGSADEFIHKRHAFNKFVHNGFQNNSQKSTKTDWQTAKASLTATATKVWHSWDKVTGDMMWVHHYEPECKCQCMGWKHLTLPITMKLKTKPSGRKLMLTLFWDSQGPILVHSQERDTTVSTACYSEMFWDE